jgi:hypothetical protein
MMLLLQQPASAGLPSGQLLSFVVNGAQAAHTRYCPRPATLTAAAPRAQAAALLSERAPIQLLSPCFEPWRGGLLSLEGVVERLAELLPATFEGLDRDFAVGVVTADGEHALIDRGPLPEAVAASAAIPLIFSSVDVPGGCGWAAWHAARVGLASQQFSSSARTTPPRPCHHAGGLSGLKDGGMVDRVGLRAWRQRRRQQHQLRNGASHGSVPPCLVHVIERSSPFSGADDAEASGEDAVQVVRCPKSGVNFFDLGDFDRQFHVARTRASSRLQDYLSHLPVVLQQQQQQQQQQRAAAQEQQQPSHASSGSIVLGSARRQPAAATAATAAQPATGAPPGAGISSGLVVPPPSSNSLLAPRSPGGSAGRSSATRRANEE